MLSQQPQQPQQQQQQQSTTGTATTPTLTLNPALHSAAATISAAAPPSRGHTCVRSRSSVNGSRKPPALVFTHESSLNSSSSSPSAATAVAVTSSAPAAMTSSASSLQSPITTTNKAIPFSAAESVFEKAPNYVEPVFADDNVSISSRGTSSTVGYR